MTYQRTAGTISQGAHPGSYNGQDAYNDLLVVSDGVFNAENRRVQAVGTGFDTCRTDVQERNRPYHRGGGNGMNEPTMMSDRKGHNGVTTDGTATTLTAEEKDRPLISLDNLEDLPSGESAQMVTSVVRRLTPRECERLQGMPDDWSRWGINEKGEAYELSDSARYRLQGNGIATPFWKVLLKRISAQYERDATLGSLFSGQASFEMLWEQINGKGSALWSSEIDKHAVAVAKYHFPDDGANLQER